MTDVHIDPNNATWLADSLRKHGDVESTETSGMIVSVRLKGSSRKVSLVGVKIDWLSPRNVGSILAQVGPVNAIVNIPKKYHYHGASKELAAQRGVGLLTMRELYRALGGNLVGYCPRQLVYVKKNIALHDKVATLEMVCEEVLRVHRDSLSPVDVVVADEYTLGVASVEAALERHRRINAIINSSSYGSYTVEAKERAESLGVGLFNIKEIFGALNYSGRKFSHYKSR